MRLCLSTGLALTDKPKKKTSLRVEAAHRETPGYPAGPVSHAHNDMTMSYDRTPDHEHIIRSTRLQHISLSLTSLSKRCITFL